MPRPQKPARLWLRSRAGRAPQFVILHNGREIGTGCGAGDERGAQEALATYLAETYRPDTRQRDSAQVSVADTLTLYMKDVAPHTAAPALIGYHVDHLLAFFGERKLTQVNGSLCRAYATARMAKVKASTIRRELVTLQAAFNHWHRESPLAAVPRVWKPDDGPPRARHLSRLEVAALLRAARRLRFRHVARFILIALYTGTRHAAVLALRWTPSDDAGHIDVERGLIVRMGAREAATKKRRPVSRIPSRLMAHVRIWHRVDMAEGPQAAVVRWKGLPIRKERRAWAQVVKAAGLGADVTPHVLRHTCATWARANGVHQWDISGLTGMSLRTLEGVYAHHDPDYQEGAVTAFKRTG